MSTASRFPHQPTFKPRGRRVTYHQVDALFDYLIANQELAMSYSNSRVGRYKSQKAWDAVAGILNRIPGGARKDAKAWSAFWSNYKNKLKTRVQSVKAALKSGQTTNTKLTELDMKVLPILGPSFACGSIGSGDNTMNSEDFQDPIMKPSPPGSPASPAAPSSPDTLPSPPSPPPPATAYTHTPTTRKNRSRPRKRPHRTNGPISDGSDSEKSFDMARLFSQTEDRTASALLRVAGAIETLAEAAQAQAAAARATAEGMEMIARAVAVALSKRFGAPDETDPNEQ